MEKNYKGNGLKKKSSVKKEVKRIKKTPLEPAKINIFVKLLRAFCRTLKMF